jgi:glycosyltransferase involved in cell wall biosynthesis
LEAQSYGCVPFLFNPYSVAFDIVSHKENGILVTLFNIDKYVEETIELIDNPSQLNELSKNAYESVNNFSYEKTYEKWDRIFKSINSSDKQ